MFTIKKAMNKNGYVISIGDHNPTHCEDAEDIVQCVRHYFGDRSKHTPDKCAFCEQIAKRNI